MIHNFKDQYIYVIIKIQNDAIIHKNMSFYTDIVMFFYDSFPIFGKLFFFFNYDTYSYQLYHMIDIDMKCWTQWTC